MACLEAKKIGASSSSAVCPQPPTSPGTGAMQNTSDRSASRPKLSALCGFDRGCVDAGADGAADGGIEAAERIGKCLALRQDLVGNQHAGLQRYDRDDGHRLFCGGRTVKQAADQLGTHAQACAEQKGST